MSFTRPDGVSGVFLELHDIPPPGLWPGATLMWVDRDSGSVDVTSKMLYVGTGNDGKLRAATIDEVIEVDASDVIFHADASDTWGNLYALAGRVDHHLGGVYSDLGCKTFGTIWCWCAWRVGLRLLYAASPEEIEAITKIAAGLPRFSEDRSLGTWADFQKFLGGA